MRRAGARGVSGTSGGRGGEGASTHVSSLEPLGHHIPGHVLVTLHDVLHTPLIHVIGLDRGR